ncbi:MAG TPA: FIST C-terminal domain-containing protein, partial [Candidatus Accumulibacter phosphatis]|nr:FIST C-terminal domain-containing protein [Candidatus Accumulibacter phosphatis]
MSIGSVLLAGNDAVPSLAATAAGMALEKVGSRQARGVLLFLSAEFSSQAQAAVTAVARAARCTEVAGGIAAGVFTDEGWVLDRPAVAVMVFAGDLAPLGRRQNAGASAGPILGYGGSSLPHAWTGSGPERFGGCFAGRPGHAEATAWQNGRLGRQCEVELRGARVDLAVSRGWQLFGRPAAVTGSRALDLLALDGAPALDHLRRNLPPQQQSADRLPLASLCAVLLDDPGCDSGGAWQRAVTDGRLQPVAIVAANADGSLTLAQHLLPGSRVLWAIRLPQASAADMRRSLSALVPLVRRPQAAIVFSCIGRGPYHYGGDDQDLACLREIFPHLPLIGAYGTGQMAPVARGGNRLLQNAVVSALIS